MDLYRVDAVEFEHCPSCKGFFLDKAEGGVLAALEKLDAESPFEVRGATGARFAAPVADAQSRAIEESRAESTRSWFKDLVRDILGSRSNSAAIQGDYIVAENRRRRFLGRK